MPPRHEETEAEALCCLMSDTAYRNEALSQFVEDDFANTYHQRIFRAIRKCHENAPRAVDQVSVAFELKKRETLHECGGQEYITRLYTWLAGLNTPPPAQHIERLRGLSLLRKTMKLAGEMRSGAEANPDDPAAFISEKLAKLQALQDSALAMTGPGYTNAQTAVEALGEITWAWEPWIPNGFITLVAGETGIGKSKLALRLVESIVQPREWPDSTAGPASAAPVLYVDTEGAQAMQVSRMKAAGLPMDRIILPGDDGNRHLYLDEPTTVPFVRNACERENIGLVVVDSLRSGMTGDENSSEFGEKLQPWGNLARDLNIPFIIIHHARKALSDREMSIDRLRGSSAIAALARSVITIDKPDETVSRLRVRQVKNNLAKIAEPFGVELTEYGCAPAPVPHAPRTDFKAAEAEEWLRDLLRHGPRQSKEVRDLAEEEGITQATLYRVRDAVGIHQLMDPNDPRKKLWALAASAEDEAAAP